jgi:Na+-driven multidrug efflux pump
VVEEDEEREASREDLKPERKEEEAVDTARALLGWFRLDEVGMDILGIALPAVLALAADPITALVDTAFVGHIGN